MADLGRITSRNLRIETPPGPPEIAPVLKGMQAASAEGRAEDANDRAANADDRADVQTDLAVNQDARAQVTQDSTLKQQQTQNGLKALEMADKDPDSAIAFARANNVPLPDNVFRDRGIRMLVERVGRDYANDPDLGSQVLKEAMANGGNYAQAVVKFGYPEKDDPMSLITDPETGKVTGVGHRPDENGKLPTATSDAKGFPGGRYGAADKRTALEKNAALIQAAAKADGVEMTQQQAIAEARRPGSSDNARARMVSSEKKRIEGTRPAKQKQKDDPAGYEMWLAGVAKANVDFLYPVPPAGPAGAPAAPAAAPGAPAGTSAPGPGGAASIEPLPMPKDGLMKVNAPSGTVNVNGVDYTQAELEQMAR